MIPEALGRIKLPLLSQSYSMSSRREASAEIKLFTKLRERRPCGRLVRLVSARYLNERSEV
jgi:hypothetical protein